MEYQIIQSATAEVGQRKMNKLAAEGWRFCSIADNGKWMVIVMEREVPGLVRRPTAAI